MAAQVIRDSVTMEQIISLYGYKPKHGYICCPFHGEKTPSLKIYPKNGGWCCYGCGRDGSVIDFVMEHENCKFNDAVRAIDNALHLGLLNPFEYPEDARRQQRIQKALDDFVDAVFAYCDMLIRVIQCKQDRDYKKLKQLEELQYECAEKLTADDYTFLLTWKEESQYDDYRIDKINEFTEGVAAWRRKARRTG